MAGHLTWYLLPLVVATLLTGGLAWFGWHNLGEPGARWFVATMIGNALWAGVAVVGLVFGSVGLLANAVSNALGVLTPFLWFGFVAGYTGHGQWVDGRSLWLSGAIPALGAVVTVTNPVHSAMFTVVDQQLVGGLSLVVTEPEPLLLAVLTYDYALFLIGLGLVIQLLATHDRLFFGQAVGLLVGSLVPIALGAVQLFQLEPVRGLPVTPSALSVLGLSFGYVLYREQFLQAVPATRAVGEAEAIDDLAEGVVIAGRNGSVLEINRSACAAFEVTADAVQGTQVADLLDHIGGIGPEDVPTEFRSGGRLYSVTTSPIKGRRPDPIGRTYVFRDITSERTRKQRLMVLNRVLRHNLRNDMTVIRSRGVILAETDDADRRAMAETIVDTADGLVHLGEEARAVESLLTGPRCVRTVSLATLIESACSEFPEASFDVDVPEDLHIETEEAVLAAILDQLVANAVTHHDGDPRVEISVTEHDDAVTVRLADDGPGIPAHELAAIESGTETALTHTSGLGLWLVNWATLRLGGEVSFDVDDTGTAVTLSVPTAGEPSPTDPLAVGD